MSIEAASIDQLVQWLDPESEMRDFFASDFEKAVYKTLKQIK